MITHAVIGTNYNFVRDHIFIKIQCLIEAT